MKTLRWVLAAVALVLAAAVAVTLWSTCEQTAQAEEGSPPVVRPRDAEREFDFQAAVERARAHEALVAKRRAGATPSPELLLERRMVEGIVKAQPWYRTRRRVAARLARIIVDAAMDHEQHPLIALAIAYKESSLSPGVGRLRVTGELGEEGYFQIMPRGYARQLCGKGRSMGNARANADTAMCYLAHVRATCETDDPWVYVLAYSMNLHRHGCPSASLGHRLRPSRRARAALCNMFGEEECREVWPE
jgi:hypothetical protein